MDVLSLLSHPLWFLCSLVLAVVLRMQKKGRWHSKKCRVDLTGKTAIVTGANTGIGKFVALDFARRNGRVILACRSRERGQKALEEIQRVTGNRNVVLEILDTSSMSSVRAFADRILRNEKRLDILVNNAGVSGLPHAVTSEGLEVTYATNHLGHFLLTNLLVDLMKRSAPSRIVFLASFVHYQGYIDTSNLYGKNMEKQKVYETYYCTKLMNVSCAREFADRLKTTGPVSPYGGFRTVSRLSKGGDVWWCCQLIQPADYRSRAFGWTVLSFNKVVIGNSANRSKHPAD
ncbi:retinol dehydrogenase 11-like isoform X8 [Lithobates pipiens]